MSAPVCAFTRESKVLFKHCDPALQGDAHCPCIPTSAASEAVARLDELKLLLVTICAGFFSWPLAPAAAALLPSSRTRGASSAQRAAAVEVAEEVCGATASATACPRTKSH